MTVKRVRALMQVKELSRAAAAVRGPGETREPRQVIAKFSTTQPVLPPQRQELPTPEAPPQALLERVRKDILKGFKAFPRKSAHGPVGSRYEHWEPLAEDDSLGAEVADCLLLLTQDTMPQDALEAHLTAYLVGIGKKD